MVIRNWMVSLSKCVDIYREENKGWWYVLADISYYMKVKRNPGRDKESDYTYISTSIHLSRQYSL